MTHNICFILLAVDKENNNDPLKNWGLYLFVLAFPGECVNQLGSEVKSIPERSVGWFKPLDVWHRLMLCDIKKKKNLLTWTLELIKPYHKILHNCHVSSWRPHHPDFEIFYGSRLTQPLNSMWMHEHSSILFNRDHALFESAPHYRVSASVALTCWRPQMETFSALLALCTGNSPVTGEFPAQRPVTRSFDVFFDLRLNKRLSKQWCGWWFETPSRRYDVTVMKS